MQGSSPNQPQQPGDYTVLSTITRQLERLDERMRDIATRADLEALRKDVVARDVLEPQLSLLKAQITRLEADRVTDRKDFEKRLDEQDKEHEKQIKELENDSLSRSDRLWMRVGQVATALALILSLFEFLTHLRLTP